MLRNYTISSLKQLQDLPKLDLVQFTSNGRQFPSSRNTVKALQAVEQFSNTEVVVHWDYIYIISRYILFVESVKNAILSEIHSILDYADSHPQVLGIVMHTDYPIRKDLLTGKVKIEDCYKSSVWDSELVKSVLEYAGDIVENSILKFREDYLNKYPLPKTPIFLENTTKVGPNLEGTIGWLMRCLIANNIRDFYGVCYDTEHCFAAEDYWINSKRIVDLSAGFRILVHLNTVPQEVKPGLGLDRHSETTIYECSQHDENFYRSYANDLEFYGIDYVREVKTDTMYRELKQIENGGRDFTE